MTISQRTNSIIQWKRRSSVKVERNDILQRATRLLECTLPMPTEFSNIIPATVTEKMPFILIYSGGSSCHELKTLGGLLVDLRALLPYLTLKSLREKIAGRLKSESIGRLYYHASMLMGFGYDQVDDDCEIDIWNDQDLKLALENAKQPLFITYLASIK